MGHEYPEPGTVKRKFPFWQRLLLGIAAGGVQPLCFPPVGLSLLLPICAAALLLLVRDLPIREAFRIGFVYGLTWILGDLFWLGNIFGIGAVSLCAILAFFPALFAALFAWLRVRLPGIPDWLLAAVLWTGIEYFRSEPFLLNFGWLGLGYGVINTPALALLASWFGSYGLTFFIVICGGILASCLQRRARNLALAAGICLLWLGLFLVRPPAPIPTDSLRVRLVQANSEDDESLFALSQPSPDAAVDVIVWPEYSFVSDPSHQPPLWEKLKQVAQNNHAYFLFGAEDQSVFSDAASYHNTAFLLDPDGRLIGKHFKNHTVHFFRDGVPGIQARALPTALGKLGLAICFDMDYPDVARRLVEDGAEVFLIPNDDPPEWGPVQRAQHRLMFQMRAAECGRWLARADVAGGTSIALPNGQQGSHVLTTQPTRLDVTVGRLHGKTLYIRGGWRFGQICLLSSLALWGLGLLKSRRKSPARVSEFSA